MAKRGCEVFQPPSKQASCNYVVGYDGSIGLCVDEGDHRAITIEVASDNKEPYAVTEKAYAAMLDLVTDICKRNGIKRLVWSTSKNDRRLPDLHHHKDRNSRVSERPKGIIAPALTGRGYFFVSVKSNSILMPRTAQHGAKSLKTKAFRISRPYSHSLLGIIFNGFCFINLIPHFFDYLMCPYYPALYDGLLSNCYRW